MHLGIYEIFGASYLYLFQTPDIPTSGIIDITRRNYEIGMRPESGCVRFLRTEGAPLNT
jgi:hypothetical protein